MKDKPTNDSETIEHLPIKTEFRSKGHLYTQLSREGDIAIYRQHKEDAPTDQHDRFEVVRINRHNGYKIAGHEFPPSEMYPSTKQWGTLGWTCITLEAAQKRKPGRPKSAKRLAADAAKAEKAAAKEAAKSESNSKQELPAPPAEIIVTPEVNPTKPTGKSQISQTELDFQSKSA